MPNITKVELGPGSIVYLKCEEGRPETVETKLNITVKTPAIPSVPAHYSVIFPVSFEYEEGPHRSRSSIDFYCVVQDADENAPYREIESQAVLQIAPMLRSVADQIEQSISDFDRRRAQASATTERKDS